MATGRTRELDYRFYLDGYDLSGYARKLGELKQEYAALIDAALTDAIKSTPSVGQATLGIGTFNGFFDNTATNGLHIVANGAGVKRVVMIPVGIRTAPAQGDPVYAGEFDQLDYKALVENGIVVVSIPFGDMDAIAAAIGYTQPWGNLLHAKGVKTAVNTAVGIDKAASTAFGGFMCYQAFTSNGTFTIKVQDAAANVDGSFADITGATSGSIDASTTPAAGIVALGRTATVRQYLRWQIVLGTATTCTFALSFMKATF